jgi:hypothetical protein
MKRTALSLALLAALPVLAQVPAGTSKIQIEVAPGSTLTDNVRPSTTNRNVTITRNPQDEVTATFPTHMHGGLNPDGTTLRAPDPGSDFARIKETADAPVPSTQPAFRTVVTFAWFGNSDSIVYPGQPGKSHSHTGFGNVLGGDPFQTSETLLAAGNSTSRGGILNRSAYWVPTAINTTDSKPILPTSFLVYYKGGAKLEPMHDLPIGLRIVAGDPGRMTAPSESSSPIIYRWNCRLPGGINQFARYIPQDPVKCPPGGTLGAEVIFPPCWDGVNLDSPDHKSHMAYQVSTKVPGSNPAVYEKRCPATHPKQIPHISFSIEYTIPATGIQTFRIVTDTDITATKLPGVGLHGDVVVAWNKKIMQLWVNNCLRAGMDCHGGLLGVDPEDGKLKTIY